MGFGEGPAVALDSPGDRSGVGAAVLLSHYNRVGMPHPTDRPRPLPDGVKDICRKNSEGLSSEQREQLEQLLVEFKDSFAWDEEGVGCTHLVQHEIDTGDARPIKTRPGASHWPDRRLRTERWRRWRRQASLSPPTAPGLPQCVTSCGERFLGHQVGEKGVGTLLDKVEAVRDWPVSTTKQQVKSFLGLASYYRRFVKGFSNIAFPLTGLLGKNREFKWTSECQQAFAILKRALGEAPVIAPPVPSEPFILDTDASNVGMGAVLAQPGPEENEWWLIFAGRSVRRIVATV
ncbi:hypothetical protein DPEC_G00107740 [Dallia pectoralis]|uniref:Uncharacterized protein n=1 Tax=Dallia pectoralis TaxID=75939 RepID=A0ACC2GSN0_DALPE|nr:hypothetical protein DPEC_G00107740 [Dallia pectoralis]